MVPSYFRRNWLKRLALFGLAAAARSSRLGKPGELSDAKTHRVVTGKIRSSLSGSTRHVRPLPQPAADAGFGGKRIKIQDEGGKLLRGKRSQERLQYYFGLA